MHLFDSIAILVFVILLTMVIVASQRRKAIRNVPPGPPGLPIVGNIFDIPKAYEWLAYEEWGRLYGTCNRVT